MAERADQELQALYVRLYFDEDVSAGIVENLRQRGFEMRWSTNSGTFEFSSS